MKYAQTSSPADIFFLQNIEAFLLSSSFSSKLRLFAYTMIGISPVLTTGNQKKLIDNKIKLTDVDPFC